MACILISARGEATGDRALAVHGRVLLVASSRDLLLACEQWGGVRVMEWGREVGEWDGGGSRVTGIEEGGR